MKLVKISPIARKPGKNFISFQPNGQIRFSKNLTEKIIKKHPDLKLNFYQDKEKPDCWFINFSKEDDALKLRKYKNKTCLSVGSKNINNKIAKSTRNDPKKQFKASIGKPFQLNGKEFFPLFIKPLNQ